MADIKQVRYDIERCTCHVPDACRDCSHYPISEESENPAWCCMEELLADALELLKEQQWHDASKRPPREGRYLVWGLHEFTPDHCDEPNAYWQTRIANWSNLWGWDTKVKYWRELPEPPMDETH